MYELNKHYTLDGSSRSNIGRYANHSCRPNSESVIYRGRVFIKSVRNIKPGDEITYHYGKDYYDIYIGKRRCRCVTCTLRRARERLKRRKRLERRARAAGEGPRRQAQGRATAQASASRRAPCSGGRCPSR